MTRESAVYYTSNSLIDSISVFLRRIDCILFWRRPGRRPASAHAIALPTNDARLDQIVILEKVLQGLINTYWHLRALQHQIRFQFDHIERLFVVILGREHIIIVKDFLLRRLQYALGSAARLPRHIDGFILIRNCSRLLTKLMGLEFSFGPHFIIWGSMLNPSSFNQPLIGIHLRFA